MDRSRAEWLTRKRLMLEGQLKRLDRKMDEARDTSLLERASRGKWKVQRMLEAVQRELRGDAAVVAGSGW